MKFLADENLERLVIEALRAAGHDVATLPAAAAGLRDRDVLARSVEEVRILLTNDKDFAELAFLKRLATVGIVLIRMPRSASREKASRVTEVVEAHGHRLASAMTVVEMEAIRRRPLPSPLFPKHRPDPPD
jgi:predicted nuclease of predicted toxin-antitoxin system